LEREGCLKVCLLLIYANSDKKHIGYIWNVFATRGLAEQAGAERVPRNRVWGVAEFEVLGSVGSEAEE